jgi:hypothetical protein
MQPLELAATFSAPLFLNVLFLAKLMLNVESGQLTTNSTTTANSLFVIPNSVLALLKMIPKQIARNAKQHANQILTVIPQIASGLETNINANTLQRTVMMENLAQSILAMQKLEVASTLTIAPLLNVILILIASLGDKQINSLPNVCNQSVTKDKDLANLFLTQVAHTLANNLQTVLLLNLVPFVIPTLDNAFLTNVNTMLTV